MDTIISFEEIPYDKKRVAARLTSGSYVIVFKATVKEYALKEGREISEAELRRIAREGEEHIAFTTAIDSLSRGMKSQNEIRRTLKQKKFSSEAIDIAVEKLLSYNYLGDNEYATAYVQYKGEKTGRRKMIYDLVTVKGINKGVAEEAVYDAYPDDAEIDKAVRLAQKYIDKEKKRRVRLKDRAYGFLASRGFDYEIIISALDRLDFSEDSQEDYY